MEPEAEPRVGPALRVCHRALAPEAYFVWATDECTAEGALFIEAHFQGLVFFDRKEKEMIMAAKNAAKVLGVITKFMLGGWGDAVPLLLEVLARVKSALGDACVRAAARKATQQEQEVAKALDKSDWANAHRERRMQLEELGYGDDFCEEELADDLDFDLGEVGNFGRLVDRRLWQALTGELEV